MRVHAPGALGAPPPPALGMPTDCFEVLLGYLAAPSDVALLRLVCKAWRQQTRAVLYTLSPRPSADLAALPAAFPALNTLHLHLPPAGQPLDLAPLRCLPRLRALTLRSTSPSLAADLNAAALLPLDDTPHFTSLEIGSCRLRGCAALQRLQSLCCLALVGCSLGDWTASAAQLLAPLSRLRTLRLSGSLACGPDGQPFAGLSALAALSSVALGSGAGVDDATCAELAALPLLASLELSRCHKDANSMLTVTDAGLVSLAQRRSSQLVRLVVRGHSGVTDEGLRAIGHGLTCLQHLDLRLHSWDARPPPTPGISDDGVAALTSLRALHTLKLGWCCLGEAGCEAIARLTSLTCLELHSCPSLRDAGAFRLGALPRLARLGLRGCVGVTDIALAALAKSLGRCLRELDLTGCHRNITDAGLASLRALRLRRLSLAHCERLTDAGLEALLAGPTPGLRASLAALDCSDCGRLTDRACALLAAHARALQFLSLEFCPRISAQGLGRLAGLPVLHELHLCGTDPAAAAAVGRLQRGRRCLRVVVCKQVWWA